MKPECSAVERKVLSGLEKNLLQEEAWEREQNPRKVQKPSQPLGIRRLAGLCCLTKVLGKASWYPSWATLCKQLGQSAHGVARSEADTLNYGPCRTGLSRRGRHFGIHPSPALQRVDKMLPFLIFPQSPILAQVLIPSDKKKNQGISNLFKMRGERGMPRV